MEAMHVAEAQAKDKAHQEGMHDAWCDPELIADQVAAAQMEAMHVAEAEAKDKAHQEGMKPSEILL
jgi:hypothetical protein